VGKPDGRTLLDKPRRRWEYNIKMDLREIGWGGVDWIDLAQDRDRWRALVKAVMNLRVSQNLRNFLNSRGPVSFSGRTLLHGIVSTSIIRLCILISIFLCLYTYK
jgi:hypothetical protein